MNGHGPKCLMHRGILCLLLCRNFILELKSRLNNSSNGEVNFIVILVSRKLSGYTFVSICVIPNNSYFG